MSSQNNLTLKAERIKGIMLDDKHMRAGDIQKKMLKRRRREDYNPPSLTKDNLDIKSVFENGGVCFYIKPKNKPVTRYFFYLHGGGYCSQINEKQWKFVFDMVEKTGYGAAVPIYPLAPEHSAADVFKMLMGAYYKICHDESVERIVLMGEEAGAGLGTFHGTDCMEWQDIEDRISWYLFHLFWIRNSLIKNWNSLFSIESWNPIITILHRR